MKRWLKRLVVLCLVLVLSINLLYFLVQLPVVQNWLVQRVTAVISEKLQAEVSVGRVEFRFFTSLVLEDFVIKDQARDTLLYAKSLKVGITEFKPFKKQIYASTISLEDPTVHLYRSPGQEDFNFQFIIDNLSNTDTTDQAEGLYDIRFEDVFFSNLTFRLDDSLTQKSMHIAFDDLEIESEAISIKDRRIALAAMELENTSIVLKDYKPWAYFVDEHDKEEEARLLASIPDMLNTDCWDITVGKLSVSNSSFIYDRVSRPRDRRGMDYSHIGVTDINLEFDNLRVQEDTLFTHIKSFAAKEQSGFEVLSLEADAHISPVKMEFQNLHAVTPNSNITHYYAMEFNNLYAFDSYETAVIMTGKFDRAKVSLKDVNYFAKALGPLEHNTVELSGEIYGTVENLKGRDLVIDYGSISRFEGSMSFKGLPNIDATFMSFNIKRIRTTAQEFRQLLPSVELPPSLDKLGLVRFSGKFDGFANDFVAEGSLLSQIGQVESDINFKLDDKGNASYFGHLSTQKFDLGKWVENDALGLMSITTRVDGSGLTLNSLNAEAQGEIQSIVVRGYEYKGIVLDGAIERRKFNGNFKVRDEHLDLDFAGAFNLADSIPTFNFSAEVRKADLKPLNLYKDSISISSTISLDISGNRLDNLNGELSIKNTHITHGKDSFFLESLFFEAYESGQSKIMSLQSDIATGWVEGNYNFADLPVAGQYFLQKYFNPDFVDTLAGTGKMVQQDMKFDITFNDTKNLTQLFAPRLKNIGGGHIKGSFDSGRNYLDVDVIMPSVTIDNFRLGKINIQSGTDSNQVVLVASVDSLLYKDSLLTKDFGLSAGIIKDSVDFNLTLEDSLAPNHVTLNGSLKTDFNDVFVSFRDSRVVVEGTQWTVLNGNHLIFNGQTLDVRDMVLRNGENELSLRTYIVNQTTHVALSFKDIMLKHFVPKLGTIVGMEMDGRLNGSINVMNLLNQPTIMANIMVDSFTLKNDLLGNVKLQGSLMNGAERMQLRGFVEGPGNSATITGSLGLGVDDPMDFAISIDRFSIAFLEKFANGLVDKVKGSASGLINLKGTFANPLLTGSLTLNQAGARVPFLNTEYTLDGQTVSFTDNYIDLGNMTINDAFNNTALLSGRIRHTSFRDFILSLDVETENFQFLNTNMTSTDGFYGKVYAKGYVFVTGTPELVDLYISATTTKGTTFSIPVSSSRDVGEYSFYQFVNTDTAKVVKPREYKINTTGVNINLDVTVTPDAEVNLILSEEEGDVISARGNGNIIVSYDELENMTMIGGFEVVSGEYTFAMQNIISKRFDINAGSQILWTGDPYDANLAVKAVYKLRAAPYDLIGDVLREDAPIQQSRSRIPTFLYLNLNGSLLSPDISFDIAVPDADAAIRNALDAKLQMIRLDQQELNKQVVGLLVLNRFLPAQPLGSSPNSNVALGVNNTVSEFISNQLSLYLTDWISKFVTEVELDINFRNYQNEVTSANTQEVDFQNRRELQLALTKSFFNNRVEVDLGGNFDFGDAQGNTNGGGTDPNNPNSGNGIANNVAGDFEIRYNITADGRIKLKVFRKGQYDVFQERNRNRTGIGIAYRKEFDTVKEIFAGMRRKREKRKKDKEDSNNLQQQLPGHIKPDEEPTDTVPVGMGGF